MAGDLLLRCVPDPAQGPGTSPCPPGYIVTTLDAQLPLLLDNDGFGTIAALSAALILAMFIGGLGVGTLIGFLRKAVR